ncbi:hypothetical protein [Streptomyces lydicus]|uniref:hypothetical protein n=1 Tax=Streptomyces lydicus TaxID=47763 RepID=UPI003419A8D5
MTAFLPLLLLAGGPVVVPACSAWGGRCRRSGAAGEGFGAWRGGSGAAGERARAGGAGSRV